jgi:hypothetical protein
VVSFQVLGEGGDFALLNGPITDEVNFEGGRGGAGRQIGGEG